MSHSDVLTLSLYFSLSVSLSLRCTLVALVLQCNIPDVKAGSMLKEIPKAQGQRTDLTSSALIEEVKPKTETIKELGFSKDQVSQFQQMAEHEDVMPGIAGI